MADAGKSQSMQAPNWANMASAAGAASGAAGATPFSEGGGGQLLQTKPMQVDTGSGMQQVSTKPMQVTSAPASAPGTPPSPVYTFRYEDGSTGNSPIQKDANGNIIYNPNGSIRDGRLIGSNQPDGYAGAAMLGAGDAWVRAQGQPSTVSAGNSGAVFGDGGGGGSTGGAGSITPSFGGGGFGAAPVPGAVNDTSRQRVEQALLARLEPQFQQDESRMRNQLLSSGLEVGSPAYTAELQRLQQSQNDARMQSVLAGGNEESRQVGLNAQLQNQAFGQGLSGAQFDNATQQQMFQQYMQGAQFDNATRQQMLAELLLQRNTPLNELNALRTGNQVSMPNFGNYYTSNSQAAPMFDAATAQGNYNANAAASSQSGTNALIGGAATAAAAFF